MARKLSVAIVLVLLAGCGRSQPPQGIVWQQYSGTRAYEHVAKLVGYGPRPAGSEALGRTATYIMTQLQDYGLTTEEQVFTAPTPYGPKQFRNVIARTRVQQGGQNRTIIIASHYDTKSGIGGGFQGANDSGSSTGLLLELARQTGFGDAVKIPVHHSGTEAALNGKSEAWTAPKEISPCFPGTG